MTRYIQRSAFERKANQLRCVLVAFVCLLPVSSVAQSAKKEITITQMRALGLFNAITGLDAKTDRVIKDGSNEKTIQEPYKFEPGLRTTMARNLSALRPIVEGYEKDRNALIVSLSDKGTIPPEKTVEFSTQERALALIEVKVMLHTIAEKDLRLDQNPSIPIAVLSALDPILEYTP